MVASQQSDMSWVFNLQAKQQLESFHRIKASVDEVTHENISSFWDLASFLEKLEQIVELTVYVSAYCDGGLHRLNVALFNENIFDQLTKDPKISFIQNSSVFTILKPLVDLLHFYYMYAVDQKVNAIYNLCIFYFLI